MVAGFGFVRVRDGVVVATTDANAQGKDSHAALDYDPSTDAQSVALINAGDAFVACPGQTLDAGSATTFAVAGAYVKDDLGSNGTGFEYTWMALQPN